MKQALAPKKSANITFNDQGVPFSSRFKDIYFDDSDGYQQSEEVFIRGNNLAKKWQISEHTCFVIAETGFGSGLNFLLTLQHFAHFKNKFPQSALTLKFISVEKYPLSAAEISKSLAIFPRLTSQVNELVKQYPNQPCGTQKFTFLNGLVCLDIIFDDACQGFKTLTANSIDAWFLDGFAPSKNPDMWHPNLYQQMARLSKVHASLATFTIAGKVRRELSDAGFLVRKQLTQGKKDEILVGVFQGKCYQRPKQAFKIRQAVEKPKHVTIIGGGLASACTAYRLCQQGIKVTLLCQDDSLAKKASSNAIGAIYPLIHQTRDTISTFYAQAFEHALALYQELTDKGYNFSHNFNGLLELAYKEALIKRQQKFAEKAIWPSELIYGVNAAQASKLSGIELAYGGLFMPKAGWVCPPELVKQTFQAAVDTGLCDIQLNIDIKAISSISKNRWQLTGTKLVIQNAGNNNLPPHKKAFNHQCKTLVLCPGAEAVKLEVLKALPLSVVRGQITQMNTTAMLSSLKTVICYKGYLTPENNGSHCIGATFDKDDDSTDIRQQDNQFNLAMLDKCMPGFNQKVGWSEQAILRANARLRCCTPDHMPIVGALPDMQAHQEIYWKLSKDKNLKYDQVAPTIPGLFVLTGLGARGLCSAPLLSDILCAEICNQAYPVDHEMLFNLAPNRFVIRDIIRS